MDERAFFPEASGTARSFPDSSYHHLSMSPYNKSYSNSHHFQNLTHNNNNNSNPRQQEQHCFVLGTDFKSARASKSEKDETTHRPLHHFFGDHQWPPKTTDSWLDLAPNSTIPTGDYNFSALLIFFFISINLVLQVYQILRVHIYIC